MSTVDGISRSCGDLDLKELFRKGYNNKEEAEEDKFANELTKSMAKNEKSTKAPGTPPYPGAKLLPEFYDAVYLPKWIMEAPRQGSIVSKDG